MLSESRYFLFEVTTVREIHSIVLSVLFAVLRFVYVYIVNLIVVVVFSFLYRAYQAVSS